MGQQGEVLEIIEETMKIQVLSVRLRKTRQDIKAVYYKFCHDQQEHQTENRSYPGHIMKLRYSPHQRKQLFLFNLLYQHILS